MMHEMNIDLTRESVKNSVLMLTIYFAINTPLVELELFGLSK